MAAPLLERKKHELLDKLDDLQKSAYQVIFDKEREIALAICCLLADGHLLIEDIPGVGKTTLVKTLARLMNLETSRIQFTNDLLPADILGSSIFRAESNAFVFHRGPIFAQLVLADELNRSTPKTQSACLQAMEERAVSIDGVTYELPQPFFLVATQNPRQQIGTFALPESQLDRFLMRIEMGFPSREAERRLLKGENREQLAGQLLPVLAQGELRDMQQACRQIHTSDAVLTYIQNLVEKTRSAKSEGQGLSPRGALALTRASQAWAYLQRRSLVLPEDVQAVAVAVMSHRLNHTDDLSGQSGVRRALDILSTVSVD